MVNLVHSAMAGLAEKLINRYLALDPELPYLIESLQGKTLKVSIEDLRLSLLFVPNPKGFSLYINSHNEAEAHLSGRVSDLLEFAFSTHPQSLVSSGKIKQSGDIHILQAFQRFIEQSQVDWEGLLAKIIGDAAAFELCKASKKAKAWHRSNLKSTCLDVSEYLQEEKRLLPTREEVEDFFEDIAKLREDVERLEAKMDRLK